MNKYLVKLASKESKESIPLQVKKDAFALGTLVAAGGLGNMAATKIMGPKPSSGKAFLLGGGLGLIGDYAALKVNDAFNKYMDKKK